MPRSPFCILQREIQSTNYSYSVLAGRGGHPIHSRRVLCILESKLKKNQQEDICSLFLLLAARLSDQLITDAVMRTMTVSDRLSFFISSTCTSLTTFEACGKWWQLSSNRLSNCSTGSFPVDDSKRQLFGDS
jgi:hypothetical protein